MHLLSHHDAQRSQTLPLPAYLSPASMLPASTMAAKLRILCGWLKARRDYYAEEMNAFEFGDHPDADHCRIREAAVQRVMDQLEVIGLQLPGWAAKTPAVERPCSINTLPSAQDIGHGQEVPAAAPVRPTPYHPVSASTPPAPLIPDGYALLGKYETLSKDDLVWDGGRTDWDVLHWANLGLQARAFLLAIRPI